MITSFEPSSTIPFSGRINIHVLQSDTTPFAFNKNKNATAQKFFSGDKNR